ncbi:hypothetical protein OK006_7957 [Actinobacteria bacterium OK006]|nr:hypothetical protein OK006_7957 [Actinobacteria bacterium OK006]
MTDDLHRSHPPTTSTSIPNPAHTRPMTSNITMHSAQSGRGEAPMTDEGGSDTDEAEEVLGLAFVTAVQTATSCQPGHCPLHDPAMPTQSLRRLDSLAGDGWHDSTCSEPSPQMVVVVPLVAVKLGRLPAAWSAAGPDGRDAADQRLQSLAHPAPHPPPELAGRAAGPAVEALLAPGIDDSERPMRPRHSRSTAFDALGARGRIGSVAPQP